MTANGSSTPPMTRRRALIGLTGAAIAGLTRQNRAHAATTPPIVAPLGLGDDGGPEIILKIAGDDGAAKTIIPEIAKYYLIYRGASGIVVSEADKPWTTQVTGTMLNGQQVAILIRASSSADGFTQLAGGNADIGLTTRMARPNEVPGFDGLTPAQAARNIRSLALDAVELIVNKATGIESLSVDDCLDIFVGKVRDWSVLGGNPGPIRRYGRPVDYGSNKLLSASLANNPVLAGLRVVQSYAEMWKSVAEDPQSIGYIAANMRYQDPKRWRGDVVPVKFKLGTRVTALPDEYGIATNDYPLVLPIMLYRVPGQDNLEVDSFFAQAESVQADVIELQSGFIAVRPQLLVPPQFDDGEPSRYAQLTRNALRVSTTVRFDPGSVKVDSRTKRLLDALGSYLRRLDIPQEQLRHLVFCEETGIAERNAEVCAGLGDVFARELGARNVRVGHVIPFGAEQALASSKSPLGQWLNRRVETWVIP
jgi:phosphate transport system substrate-binding protein